LVAVFFHNPRFRSEFQQPSYALRHPIQRGTFQVDGLARYAGKAVVAAAVVVVTACKVLSYRLTAHPDARYHSEMRHTKRAFFLFEQETGGSPPGKSIE